MSAHLPVRRLVDDYHFHLAQTELPNDGDNQEASPLPGPDLPHIGQLPTNVILSCAFAGTPRGHGISVAYAFDPGGSGTVVFNWRILLDSRCEPIFVAYRNGKRFHQASRQFVGKFSDVLARNERYQFQFGLIVGGRELERPAFFELIVPTVKAPETAESLEARCLKRDAWKQKEYEEAKRWTNDQQELKLRFAEIDEAARAKFGEI